MSPEAEQATEAGLPGGGPGAGRAWVRDWRVWLGILITLVSLWLAMRGIPLGEVRAAMAKADVWVLALLSVVGHCGATWLRAVRWAHLVEPIAPASKGLLFRGQALGFMLNNLIPLRIGELVRAWYVARESGARVSALIGTIVLERTIDVISVLLMAFAGLTWLGVAGDPDSQLASAARYMLPVAMLPIGGLLLLRFAAEPVIATVHWILRPFPETLGQGIEGLIRGFAEGLSALTGGVHLVWIALWSAVIWLVLATLPVYGGIVAFGLDFGGFSETLVTSWVLLAAVGVAVAIPSAPGFFGVYQLAFRLVLEPLGVDGATALALGLLVWFFFWIILIVQGFVVLRSGPGSIASLLASSGKAPQTERR